MSVGLILNLLYELNKSTMYIMGATGKHNIILFYKFNKFSNEPA